jgi:hypothetical protein
LLIDFPPILPQFIKNINKKLYGELIMEISLKPAFQFVKNHYGKAIITAMLGTSGAFGLNYFDDGDAESIQRGAVTKVFNQEVADTTRADYLFNYMFSADQAERYEGCEQRVKAIYDADDRQKITLLISCMKNQP